MNAGVLVYRYLDTLLVPQLVQVLAEVGISGKGKKRAQLLETIVEQCQDPVRGREVVLAAFQAVSDSQASGKRRKRKRDHGVVRVLLEQFDAAAVLCQRDDDQRDDDQRDDDQRDDQTAVAAASGLDLDPPAEDPAEQECADNQSPMLIYFPENMLMTT